MNILLVLVILLTVFTCFRLMKVFDLAAKLRGREPYEISESENNMNALLILLSLVGLITMFFFLNNKYYGPNLLPNASKHGIEVDKLLHLNFVVISIAFLICQVALMGFAYKYRYNKKRRAQHFAHSTRLELVWTILPAIVLVFLIGKGLIVWNLQMWPKNDPDKLTIEVYSRQFEWRARFSGADKTLGESNFTMIDPVDNELGIITPESIEKQLKKCKDDLRGIDSLLKYSFPNKKKYKELKTSRRRKNFQIQRVIEFKNQIKDKKFTAGYDDMVFKDTIHIPVNRTIELMIRSQDVIHGVYFPHFRVQMYSVPGVQTKFTFMPILTTAQMREKIGNPTFNYLLLCNNICGAAHFNMQMQIVVDTPEDFKRWIDKQKTFGATDAPAVPDTVSATGNDSIPTDTMPVVINNNGH